MNYFGKTNPHIFYNIILLHQNWKYQRFTPLDCKGIGNKILRHRLNFFFGNPPLIQIKIAALLFL